MKVGAICNREVVIIHRAESVIDAAKRMRDQHVGTLVVVEENVTSRRPVGIITDRDLVVGVLAQDHEDLIRLQVGDVMSYELVTVAMGESVDEALQLMRSKAVRRVPVVDGKGILIGILALDDLLDFFAERFDDIVTLVGRQPQVERRARM